MMSTSSRSRAAPADRRIPTWAAGLVAGLARDLPALVTRNDLRQRLADSDSSRDVESAIAELRRLGWLRGLPVHGTWAFIPPGRDHAPDPYIALKAWREREPRTSFRLAGATAAWHLGYLDRAPEGRVQVWLPPEERLPDGLRGEVSVLKIKWATEDAEKLEPSTMFLVRRKLDIVSWASGLPCLGPEGLTVQLAARPASFAPWADLVSHLHQLVEDCDDGRLLALLRGQSLATWQRAAYLLHSGGHPTRGIRLFARRPAKPLPKTHFRHPRQRGEDEGLYVPEYGIVDQLIFPLQGLIGKA